MTAFDDAMAAVRRADELQQRLDAASVGHKPESETVMGMAGELVRDIVLAGQPGLSALGTLNVALFLAAAGWTKGGES